MNRTVAFGSLFFAASLGLAQANVADRTWTIDPVHSSAQFTVTHLQISKVTGTIPITKSNVIADPTGRPESIDATLDASGIDTHNAMRDGDLKSDHYFNVAKYPTIRFVSRKVTPLDAKTYDVEGDFTLHGVTKPVTLHTTFLGHAVGLKGEPRAAYEATTTIERSAYGMSYGEPLVGDAVAITIDVEGTTGK